MLTGEPARVADVCDRICLREAGRTFEQIADEPLWGGSLNSMVVVALIAEILRETSADLDAGALARMTTLRELAGLAERAGGHPGPGPGPGPGSGSGSGGPGGPGWLTPLPNRRGYFLRRRDGLARWLWRTPLLRAHAPLDPARLTRAAERLVARHDGLRIRVEVAGGEVRERVAEAAGLHPVVVLDAPPGADPGELRDRAGEYLSGLTFDDELFAVLVLGSPSQGYRHLVLAAHHLLVDVVSIGIVWRELERLYLDGETDPGPVTTPLAELAAARWRYWHERPEPVLEHWAAMPWADVDERLCPVAPEGAAPYGRESTTRDLAVPLGAWDPDRTSFEVAVDLLTACAVSARRCCGQSLVQIDVVLHGRAAPIPGVDASRTVGYLSETVPVFVRPDDGPEARREVARQLDAAARLGGGLGHVRHLDPPPGTEALRASWSRSRLSVNVVLPEIRRPLPTRLGAPVAAPPAVRGEDAAARVYAASAGLVVADGTVTLRWDWGEAMPDETMHAFAHGCARAFADGERG